MVSLTLCTVHANGLPLLLSSALLVLGASGCESLSERGKYLTGADAFSWTDERFRIKDKEDMWGQVGVYEGKLDFFAKGFPPGTKFSVGTTTATTDDEGNAKLEAPAQDLYGALPFGKVEMPTVEGVKMTVETPGAEAFEITLPPISVPFVEGVLLGATEGPVLFAGDDPEDASLDNIVLDPNSAVPLVVGAAPKTLGEVDAIAVMNIEPTGQTKECTGYVDEAGKAMPPVQLKLGHTSVVVHARRTGKQLGTKVFDPVESCPESFTKWSDEDPTSLRPYIPTGDIETWLKTLL